MIFELSHNVWWGDRCALVERPDRIASVINVSQNQRSRYFHRLGGFPQEVPYFRLGRRDGWAVDDQYIRNLTAITDLVISNHWFPVMVHCVAGGHRSPAAAVFFEWHMNGRTKAVLEAARAKMLVLRPDACTHRPYHRSLMDYCANNCSTG